MGHESSPTTIGVMLTLATLTAMAPTERPSGETLLEQEERLWGGISALMEGGTLWTEGWSLEWIGLTDDRANMAYIASACGRAELAVCIRGTVFSSLTDLGQDLGVGMRDHFDYGGHSLIASGAMAAFNAVRGARCVMDVGELGDTTLVHALEKLTAGNDAPTVYVTGHSLGGALTTTLGLYLRHKLPTATINPYTFAAPTAGDKHFAENFDRAFPHAVCTWNEFDAVPRAWQDVLGIEQFYPSPGPAATSAEKWEIYGADALRNGHVYVQPTRQSALNQDFGNIAPDAIGGDPVTFVAEIAYQHACDTYLELLGAPTVDWLIPALASLAPNEGPSVGCTQVTIEPAAGTTFTPDCVVDFGDTAAASATVAADGSSITATSPKDTEWVWTRQVTVTNAYGTSNGLAYTYDWDW